MGGAGAPFARRTMTRKTRRRIDAGLKAKIALATDPLRAFGSVIGKALSPRKVGQGLIRILVLCSKEPQHAIAAQIISRGPDDGTISDFCAEWANSIGHDRNFKLRYCRNSWCGRRESNPYDRSRGILSPLRLPVSPRPQFVEGSAPAPREFLSIWHPSGKQAGALGADFLESERLRKSGRLVSACQSYGK